MKTALVFLSSALLGVLILLATGLPTGGDPSPPEDPPKALFVRHPLSFRLTPIVEHESQRLGARLVDVMASESVEAFDSLVQEPSFSLFVVEVSAEGTPLAERSEQVEKWIDAGGKLAIFMPFPPIDSDPSSTEWIPWPEFSQRPGWVPGESLRGSIHFEQSEHPLIGTDAGRTWDHVDLDRQTVTELPPEWTVLARDPHGVSLAVRTQGKGEIALVLLPSSVALRHESSLRLADRLAHWGGLKPNSPGYRPADFLWREFEDVTDDWPLRQNLLGASGRGAVSDPGRRSLPPIEATFIPPTEEWSLWLRAYEGHNTARGVSVHLDDRPLATTHISPRGESFTWWRAAIGQGREPKRLRIEDSKGTVEILDAFLVAPRDFDPVVWSDGLKALDHDDGEQLDFLQDVLPNLAPPREDVPDLDDWDHTSARWRQQLKRSLGWEDFPLPRPELEATLEGETDRGDHRLQRISYTSMPGFRVPSLLYLPKDGAPHAAVLIAVGHWSVGKADKELQKQAVHLARQGIAAMIPETLGQGERTHPDNSHETAFPLMLSGMTARGVMLHELSRALDYLQSRDDIRGDAIGICGSSAGGLDSWMMAALDERIRATAPVAFITGFRELFERTARQCPCIYFPDLARHLHAADIIDLAAPIPFLHVFATRDQLFPASGSRRVTEEAMKLYERLAPGRLTSLESDDLHAHNREMREAIAGFMVQALDGRGDGSPIVEREIDTLDARDPAMVVFRGKNPSTRTLLDLAQKAAQTLREKRAHQSGMASANDLRKRLRESLAVILPPQNSLRTIREERTSVLGYDVEKGRIESPLRYPLPFLHLHRSESAIPVILIASAPKATHLLSEDVQAWLDQGYSLILPDLPGTGELHQPDFLATRNGIFVQRPYLGRRLSALLTLLRSLPDESRPILWGRDLEGSLLAELAAALDPRVRALVANLAFESFEALIGRDHAPESCYPARILQSVDLDQVRATISLERFRDLQQLKNAPPSESNQPGK